MNSDITSGMSITKETLIGTFDILGAKSLYASLNTEEAESVSSFVIKTISEATCTLTTKVKKRMEGHTILTKVINDIISHSSSYFYADTIVFICGISEVQKRTIPFAYDYFVSMAEEITRRMFNHGLPIRGCLNYGMTAHYHAQDKMVVSGKAYVESVRNVDALEFSGTVLTKEFYDAFSKNNNVSKLRKLYPVIMLPCVVKDKQNKTTKTINSWCLDWIDNSKFLLEHADIRQLIFNSFASHGKTLGDSVVEKINNTETVIRLLIHRRAEQKSSQSVKLN